MTEEEFVALLKIEGKSLYIDMHRFRTKKLQIRPHYSMTVINPDGVQSWTSTKYYRSRAYAAKVIAKKYYENN